MTGAGQQTNEEAALKNFIGDIIKSSLLLVTFTVISPSLFADETLAAEKDYSFVAAELRDTARMIDTMSAAGPKLGEASLAQIRVSRQFSPQPPLTSPQVEKRMIKGAAKSPDVAVYVINANPGERRPAILHMHGGGFVLGSAESSVTMLQKLSTLLDCVIVTVEYRLAPETLFSGSIEDH